MKKKVKKIVYDKEIIKHEPRDWPTLKYRRPSAELDFILHEFEDYRWEAINKLLDEAAELGEDERPRFVNSERKKPAKPTYRKR